MDKVYAGDWAWGVGVIEPEDVPIDRHEAVVSSLRLAVTLAKTERFEHYLSGFAALETWADQLLDESRFTGLTEKSWFQPAHANGYCYGCLYSTRLNAENYLRLIAREYDDPIRSSLLEVAGLYKREHELLGRERPEYKCAWSLMPWRIGSPDKWTVQMRRTEAAALREALAIEREAIARIENLLPQIAQPVSQ